MTTSMTRAAALCVLLATTALVCPAAAQTTASTEELAPVRQSIDANGVDLFHGTLTTEAPVLSIGQGDQALVLRRSRRGTSGWIDNLTGRLQESSNNVVVGIGNSSDGFTLANGVYTNTEGNGATLTRSGGIYTYTSTNGTVARFQTNGNGLNTARVIDVRQPSGAKLVYTYELCSSCSYAAQNYRLVSVRNSHGYQLNFVYPAGGFALQAESVNVENRAAPTAEPIASVPLHGDAGGVTDAMGRFTDFHYTSGSIDQITLPGSTNPDVAITYGGPTNSEVTSVTTAAGKFTYSRSDDGFFRTVIVTDPAGNATTYQFRLATQRLHSVVDAAQRRTTFSYMSGRLKSIVHPGGSSTSYVYDERGNVTETRRIAQENSGLADIVTTATYDTVCSNRVTCNQPNSTTDARGQVTDFTYDPNHGGLLTVTLPAPATGAVRPQTRFSYAPIEATFRNNAGVMGASGEPVMRLTGASTCQTQANCTGTADEVLTTIAYGAQAAGSGNNQLPLTVSQGSGDGALTASTTYGYDSFANVITVDGPLPGSEDTIRNRYNKARELIGTVLADPDGSAGPLRHHAVRTTIDARGLTTMVEDGTVAGQTDANWANFDAAERVEIDYDHRRPVGQRLMRGDTTYALTQTSYDQAGRVDCTVQRMNSAAFATAPADACALGAPGSEGPDRIAHNVYDEAGRLKSVETGYRTAGVLTETVEYNAIGQQSAVIDGNGNRTEYLYDGHGRLMRTLYPSATGNADATDYEELAYDAAGNVVSRRLRDGIVHGYSYDRLGRLTGQDLPDPERDVTYGYDLLGRVRSVSTSDHALSFTWDALGRNLAQVSPQGTLASSYDLAGRRTQLSYPGGGLTIDYDYQVTGEMTRVRENGATSGLGVLATYAYDSRGRRLSLTRGNGSVQTYAYDPVSRLLQFKDELAGTSHDRTLGFAYNPAGQIASTTRSNDLFAAPAANVALETPVNGRNRVTRVTEDGASDITSYDPRGNMTGDGTNDYTYTSQNQLTGRRDPGTTVSNPSLGYDPLGRLYRYTVGGVIRRFGYDGDAMIAEYNSANAVQRRYVHGAGVDEPLVQYDGTGTATRRWLHADERGSIVARSDDNGAVDHVNTYDEYGVPGADNIGRFGYTGQVWLPELGVYYYRARMYNPRLGRFMQADPIGYGAGLNLYAYVGGDPVNFRDPSGLFEEQACGANGYPDCPEIVVIGKNVSRSFDLIDINYFSIATTPQQGGGGGGGGASSRSSRNRTQCISPNDGPVIFAGAGFDVTVLTGGGFGFYRFSIPTIGARGWVASGSWLFGAGAGAGVSGGSVDTWGNFVGEGGRFVAGTGEMLFSQQGGLVGGSGSVGRSNGLYGGFTRTRLLSSNMPECR